jgi:hypothetical protein
MTLAGVESHLLDVCGRAGVSIPDVILDNRNGKFTAVWFAQKLALIIDGETQVEADVLAFPDLTGDELDEAA